MLVYLDLMGEALKGVNGDIVPESSWLRQSLLLGHCLMLRMKGRS